MSHPGMGLADGGQGFPQTPAQAYREVISSTQGSRETTQHAGRMLESSF